MAKDVTDSMEFEQSGPLLVNITHRGDAHFAVKLSNVAGGRGDTLVNTIGDFDGQVVTPVGPGTYVFEVDYGSEYTIEPTEMREIQQVPITLNQTDPYVVPIKLEGPIKIDLIAQNDCHVGVTLLNGLGQRIENVFNEIGPAESTAMVQQTGEGLLFFDIEGEWSAEISDL